MEDALVPLIIEPLHGKINIVVEVAVPIEANDQDVDLIIMFINIIFFIIINELHVFIYQILRLPAVAGTISKPKH